MSFACIFHGCFLLGLSKEKEDLENINFFSQEKFFVVTHFKNNIRNITINSNWLREIAESLINSFQSS